MTDAEIIKALECCTKGNTSDVCVDCPLRTTDICTEEENGVLKLALDLINRQKVENERLQSILLCFMDEVKKWENKHCLDVSELPLIPIKGETEKIKKQIKAEAIKEFAERLKGKAFEFYYGERCYKISETTLNNLVKEMAGDTE